MATIHPEELLPLTPAVFHILLALADGEKHGYSIMQEIATTTENKVKMGPGTLYGSIKRMLAANLIVEWDGHPRPDSNDRRRRYYRLTSFGHRVLSAEAKRLADAVRLAQSKIVLGGVS